MKFLNEGDSIEVWGSGKKPYVIRKIGGVIDCSCPSWKNLGGKIDTRVCKHIKANVDFACLLPQQRGEQVQDEPKLTKTGKISTAVGGVVVKDTAPDLLLAHKWEDEDPTGWWISVKLDGVRAFWDGENFISRLGNTYHAPEFFKQSMPKNKLDGELWIGERKFQETISTVRKLIPDDKEWMNIRYMVFDIIGVDKPFEERQKILSDIINSGYAYCTRVEQIKCLSKQHLEEQLKQIESKGGEGLMLRKPGSMYEVGRSNTLLKVKTFHDAEATVVGYEPGRGKHKGRIGAVVVEMKNGKTFSVGSGFTDKQRENPPKIGATITYRYQELSRDLIPRFPTYLRERQD